MTTDSQRPRECTVCGYGFSDKYCRICGNDPTNPMPPNAPGVAALRRAYSSSGEAEDHRRALPLFQEAAKQVDSYPPVLAIQMLYDYLRCHYQATSTRSLAGLSTAHRETVIQLAREGQKRLSEHDDDYFRGPGKLPGLMFESTLKEAATLGAVREALDRRSGCFVATAAFGSPYTREVMLLRAFRDDHLSESRIGRALIRLYYRASPTLARQLKNRPSIRALTRGVLRKLLFLLGARAAAK